MNHWFVKDDDNPYTEVSRFDWIRGYHVGGRSITWGRQSYRWSDLDFEANSREGVGVDWPIRYADLAPWYDKAEIAASAAAPRACHNCRTASSSRRWTSTPPRSDLKNGSTESAAAHYRPNSPPDKAHR